MLATVPSEAIRAKASIILRSDFKALNNDQEVDVLHAEAVNKVLV